MARYYHNTKIRAEGLKKMCMSFFTRYGYLKDGPFSKTEGLHIWKLGNETTGTISFKITKDDTTRKGILRVFFSHRSFFNENCKEMDYQIRLIATECYFGGLRWWFIDPCSNFERKCSVLYLQDNGYFTSWKTLNLSYDSQNEGRGVLRAHMQSIRGLAMYNRIKYKYRNGKPTRKMKRALQYISGGLSAKNYTPDDVVKQYFRNL